MLRILKYLKPFLLMLVVAVALLFVQADADLTLPDYMSRIVNVGIQQGGVEHAVPEALRKSTMEHAFLFLTDEEQAAVKAHYRLVDKSSPDYETYVQKYPALAKEPIYVLEDSSRETIQQLEPIMSKAMLLVFGIEQIEKNPAMAKKLMPNAKFDLSKLPPGTDLFALMAQMPVSQRQQIVKSMSLRFEAIGGEKAMVQAAARAVKAEYDALGMNTSRIQNHYILYTGGLMLLIALISAVATVSVGYLAAKISAGFGRDLRHYLFEKVMRFSGAEFDRFSTASLITRVHGTSPGRWSACVVPYIGMPRLACAQATAYVECVCTTPPIPLNAL